MANRNISDENYESVVCSMRKKFRYWLVNYKTFSQKKADAIIAEIGSLSSEAVQAGIFDYSLYSITQFILFAKVRKSLHNKRQLTSPEKRALELYGDFLQFVELTSFVFPEDKSRLPQYCAEIKMAYSYKAVLLLGLLQKHRDGKCDIENLTDECILYYKSRINKGLIAEKENSIFARPVCDRKEAMKILITNPIAVLEKDGVIVFDKKSGIVTFQDEYYPDEPIISQVKTALITALEKYYTSLSDKLLASEQAINEMLNNIRTEITHDINIERRQKSLELLITLESLWSSAKNDEISKQVNTESLKPLSEDDPRRIGKLVKETMQALSENGLSFSKEELAQFTDKKWSKEHLHIYYAFMKIYDSTIELTAQTRDYLGTNRYWKQIFTFGGVEVLITSEWYKGDKPFFIRWYNSLLHDCGIN